MLKNQVSFHINNKGLYFPPYSCYDVDFILQFGADKKKVSINLILLHLSCSKTSPVYLPEFKINKETKKNILLNYCLNDSVMKDYLPDKEKLTEISRSFLLMVSINIISKAYLQQKQKLMG